MQYNDANSFNDNDGVTLFLENFIVFSPSKSDVIGKRRYAEGFSINFTNFYC